LENRGDAGETAELCKDAFSCSEERRQNEGGGPAQFNPYSDIGSPREGHLQKLQDYSQPRSNDLRSA